MPTNTLERRVENAGIIHTHYRIVPATFAPGFWQAICKVCPPGADRYSSAKNGNSHTCEEAVIAHLKDKHGITGES